MEHLNIGKWTYDGLNESPAGRSQFLQIAVDFVDTVLFAGFQIGIDGQEDARSSAAIAEMAEYNFSFEEFSRSTIGRLLAMDDHGPRCGRMIE